MTKQRIVKEVDPSKRNDYLLKPFTKIATLSEENELELAKEQSYVVDFIMSECMYKFDSTKNPYAAFEIFARCIEKNLYPPVEILTFMREKLSEYLYSENTLDSVFGLGKVSKRRYKNEKRDIKIVDEIDALLKYFDINTSEAVEAVDRRLESKDIKLQDTTILDIYQRGGKEELENSLMFKYNDLRIVDDMSQEYKREQAIKLTKKYPKDIKERLKNKIK